MIQFTFSKLHVLNYSKWVLFLVITFLIQHVSSAQNRIVNQLNQVRATTVSTKYTLFSRPLSSARLAADSVFVPGATVYRFSLNKETASLVENQPTPFLELSLPFSASQSFDLELIPFTIFSPTFKVTNARGETIAPQALGSYYHGIIKGDPQSAASISIINGEISGIISNKDGNYNLGKEPKTPNYIFYNDKDLRQKSDFTCGTPDAPVKAMGQNLIKQEASLTNVACGSVEIYLEADNALYQAQGSTIPTTVSYVNSLFSNVATLYNNEGLSVVISEIKVWDTADPYMGAASTSTALTAFRNKVGTSFNGRLAHLLSGRGLGGGIAYLDVLCEKSYAHGVSASLSNTITAIPNYSWNVEVVTHELGHNFGSPHTQSCTWPGGAIDNCYTTEGGCAPGPAPVNGGTIMSYCHLTGYGINFANGFGTLPGNLIRNYTQACLGSAAPPTNLTTLELYDTQALVSWTHDAGTYTVEYKPASSGTWITAGTTGGKNKFLTSLTPNTAYEWRVKVNCSNYAVGTFTTNSTPAPPLYCTTTHTNGCTYGILMTGVQIGGTTLSSASGCVSGGYNFITSPTKDLSLGQSVNFTINLEGYYNDSQLSIWIDLNGDHLFQTGEKLYTTSAFITQTLTGTLTIPTGSSLGKTRMRIILNYSYAISNKPDDPCGTYAYGETEDYYVNLVCNALTQFTVTGGGSFCAGGNGVAVGLSGSQTGVNYQLKRNGSNTGTAIAGTGSALSFGLQNTAATYTIEASTANCSATLMTGSSTVTVLSAPTLVAGAATNPTTCAGTNGSITFATNNLPNGNYSLSFTGTGSPKQITVSSNAFTLSGLSAGTYSNFSITNNGCTGTETTTKTLSSPPTPTLVAGAATNPTTCAGTNGSIAFATTNLPNGNYSLSFTGTGSPKQITVSSNTFTLSGLVAGTYSNFSITNNNCTGSDATAKTLSNPPTPTLVAGAAANPTTCAGTNGSIAFATTNLANGTYPLTFTGTGSPKSVMITSNTFTLSGLSAGTYSNFSITNNDCTGTEATTKTLSSPPTPTLVAGLATNPTTCAGTNGSITFATTNLPNGNYSLSFTGTGSPKQITVSSNAFTLSGLSAGSYSNFSITNNGCTGNDPTIKTLTNPPSLTLVAGAAANPTTCAGTNGSIAFATTNLPDSNYSLTFTGTGSPKSVTITSNTFTLSGLSAGTYSNFSITNNGCTGTEATTKTLSSPPTPTLVAGLATNPTTCAGTNGSITFATTNLPNGNYSLSFTGTGSPKQITVSSNAFTLSGLSAGSYSNFSITNNGCTGNDPTIKTLTNPPSLTLVAGAATNPTTCAGTNGSIAFATTNLPDSNYSLTFTGTGSPKSVTITSNTFTLSGLSAGTYSNFSITNNGCTGTETTTKTLSSPPTPTLVAGAATNPTTCAGTNGSITFATTNLPNGNYSLSFTGTGSPKQITVSSNTFTLSGLVAGTYSNFSITNNNCTGSDATAKTLSNPPTPTLVAGAAANPTTCAGTNGSIAFATTNLANGTYPLTFTGTGSPKSVMITSNTFTLSGLSAGTYSNFSITNNDCTGTEATTKTLSSPPTPTLVAGLATNPTTCAGTNGSIAFATTNLPDSNYSLSFTGTGSPKQITVASNAFTLSGLSAGAYSNFSITSNGCIGNDPTSKTLTDPAPPNAGSISGTLIVCAGSTTLLTSNGVSGGIWSSSNTAIATFNAGTGIAAGITPGSSTITYSVTVNGCTGSTTATLKVDTVSAGGSISGSTAVCSGTNSTVLTLAGHLGTIQKWQSALSADFAAATDISNTTTSLTAINLVQTTYYRAIIQKGVCIPANSSSAAVSVNSIPTVSITGPTSIPIGSTTSVSPASGGTWQSNSISKATVTNAGIVTGVGIGTASFTFTQTGTGCSNTTNPVTIISNANPCDQTITLNSPADNYSNGSVLKQTNLTINAANKITGTSTTVTYQAGNSITLSPGFQAEAGTVFKTQIVGCN
jgi:hypothetical protein